MRWRVTSGYGAVKFALDNTGATGYQMLAEEILRNILFDVTTASRGVVVEARAARRRVAHVRALVVGAAINRARHVTDRVATAHEQVVVFGIPDGINLVASRSTDWWEGDTREGCRRRLILTLDYTAELRAIGRGSFALVPDDRRSREAGRDDGSRRRVNVVI